jgi:hypothetical protein
LETLECFLSKSTNYLHILASGPEKQAIYFGHAFHQDVKIPPPIQKKFKEEICGVVEKLILMTVNFRLQL